MPEQGCRRSQLPRREGKLVLTTGSALRLSRRVGTREQAVCGRRAWKGLSPICDPFDKPRRGGGGVEWGGDASPCVSPDPQRSCAVPFVSAARAAVETQSRCRDGQE